MKQRTPQAKALKALENYLAACTLCDEAKLVYDNALRKRENAWDVWEALPRKRK